MKNIFLIFISSLLIISCKNSNKAIVCKNEIKVNSINHKFSKPYHYEKASARNIKKIKLKNEIEKQEAIKTDNELLDVFANSEENIVVQKNTIRERIKRAREIEEDEPEEVIPPSSKLHTLSLISFIALIFVGLIPEILFVSFILGVISLFMLRNNKDKYYGKGFSSVPISIIAISSFVFGFIMLLVGALISAGGWGVIIAIIGAAFLAFSLLLGGLLLYYFSG